MRCLFREQDDLAGRTLSRVLLEAPALPQPAVCEFLADVASGGGDWATLALSAARDVLTQRPPDRAPILALVLAAAAGADAPLRRGGMPVQALHIATCDRDCII